MQQQIEQAIRDLVRTLFDRPDAPVELTRPEEQFGDYATNVALQLAKPLGVSPRDIAEQLKTKLPEKLPLTIESVTVAGPGFLNITIRETALLEAIRAPQPQPLKGKTVVAEYSDPNPFKVLHAGHLYTSIVGDAIANLLQHAGADVHRVNFGGDVGLHVAKAMWGILQYLGGEYPDKLEAIDEADRARYLSEWYVAGNTAYESDAQAKAAIIELNKRVYGLHEANDHDSDFARVYWTCRQWSYDYFDAFYDRIGCRFEKYYPESQTAPVGLAAVRAHPEVFTESQGATVFDGEKYGLHTRVFVNSQGLPTYETKDMGASLMKYEDYKFDSSVIITGNDIVEYMKVVLKATEQIEPHVAQVTQHLTHGNVKLAGGVKMSSRHGNVLLAVDVLDVAAEANKRQTGNGDERTTLGAVKYAFLKQRMGGDIIYDPAESVSLEGNSGPYLQYAHARARSILAKAGEAKPGEPNGLNASERSLVRKLSQYPEVLAKATTELLPHHICTYLYELAQIFNRFYEQNKVIGSDEQAGRLHLVTLYADTLTAGLGLLGIDAPEKM